MIGKKVTETFSVSPQIADRDVASIAAAGFRSILCNRPDDEELGQPAFSVIETAAKALGLTVLHQPVMSGKLDQEDVDAFNAAMAELPTPVFAYCRSGTRCIMLWALSETNRRPVSEVLEMTRTAGYDLGA